MTQRAAVHFDHQSATFLQVDGDGVELRRVQAQPESGGEPLAGFAYLGEVCDAIEQFGEVLVTGPNSAMSDLGHFIEGYRPRVERRIVGFERIGGRLTDRQLAAFARSYFDRVHRMRDVPGPRTAS